MSQDAEGVLRVSETITPSIDPWSQPEFAALRGEKLGSARMVAVAVAAEFGIVAFGNAAGSGEIVVIEELAVKAASTLSVVAEIIADTAIAGTLSAPAFFGSPRDRRFPFSQVAGRVFTRTGTDPASTFGIQFDEITCAVASQFFPFLCCTPFILRPGEDVIMVAQSPNAQLNAVVKWRARMAYNGELPNT